MRYLQRLVLLAVLFSLMVNMFCGCAKIIPDDLKEGDTITLGNYGGEEIEWIVLDVNEDKALLFSKYIIDYKTYHDSTLAKWETCLLRKWLNGKFYDKTFSSDEQKIIEITKLRNDDNPQFNTEGGNDTEDRLFLLSIDEVNLYLDSNDKKKAFLSDYAYSKISDPQKFLSGDKCGEWWLRSPGRDNTLAATVNSVGKVDAGGGGMIDVCAFGVRPAMWVRYK